MTQPSQDHDHAYELNRLNWDERVDSHFNSAMYQEHVRDLRSGKPALDPLHIERVGSVAGQKLIHLQCHMGMETLSWAMLGATVTGIDFSEPALDKARRLSSELGIASRFIRTNVYDTLEHVERHGFDVAYVSVGAICWLGDIERWASVVAEVLKPGGKLFMEEVHPFIEVLEEHATEPILYAKFPYFDKQGQAFEEQGSYADRTARFEHTKSISWNHPFSSVINALIGSGLTIRALHERADAVWPRYNSMVAIDANHFELPEPYTGKLPMMYTLIAEKG